MAKFSKYLIAALICALVFSILASIVAPSAIKMLFTPPVSFGPNCEPAADWAMQHLLFAQLISLCVGLVLGAIVFGYFSPSRKKVEQKPLP